MTQSLGNGDQIPLDGQLEFKQGEAPLANLALGESGWSERDSGLDDDRGRKDTERCLREKAVF